MLHQQAQLYTLVEPGWLGIRRKVAAVEALNKAATQDAQKNTSKQRQQKKRKTTPPEDPLPDTDIKIVLRPQGGLDLNKVNAAILADLLQAQAGLPQDPSDQVRVHHRSNFIVASTPIEERAQRYLELSVLEWQGTTYNLANHIPPPSTIVAGALFQVPPEDDAHTIMQSLTMYNHSLRIMDAKRLNGTNVVQVLFLGPLVPYCIRYRGAILRCFPFKRKQEACFACWRPGHRKDVCPNPSPTPHCQTCGTRDPKPNHPCAPSCILCGAAHLTGAAGCPNRFQPRRKPPPSLFVASGTKENQLATKTSATVSRTTTSPPMATDKRTYSQAAQRTFTNPTATSRLQVSSQGQPQLPSHIPPNQTLPPNNITTNTTALLQEMQSLRETILQLRQENARLAQENHALKQQLSQTTTPSTQARDNPQDAQSPPLKRRATPAQSTPPVDQPTSQQSSTVLQDLHTAIRTEMHNMHASLQMQVSEQITTLQQSMHDLHKEVLQWMRTISPQVQDIPVNDIEPANIPITIDTDNDQGL